MKTIFMSSLENQTYPHAGTSEVTNSAGTLQTPNANTSKKEEEDEDHIVVPTTLKHTAAKVKPMKSSTNSKAEELLQFRLQQVWILVDLPHGAKIMAASAIAISSDSSDESVGSPPSRVILFGDIPTVIPSTSVVALETSTIALVISSAAPVVETTLVASPTGLVTKRPSSSFEFPIAHVTAPPEIRRCEAFCRWCAAPLSTLYPPTTSESSSGDSSERPLHSSSRSAGPSRKRCRSPVDSVPSSTPVMGSLAPTRADLLPPRKRFRDSYSSEASIEEDTEIDPIETEVDMELGIGDGDDVRDHVEIDPRDVRDDTEGYEADTSAGDTVEVAHEAIRVSNARETENQSQNGSDGDKRNGGNGNGRNENPNENVRDDRPVTRECTY
ncbi:hypothetical protein Tco_1104694 [Tanacetum coccineum]